MGAGSRLSRRFFTHRSARGPQSLLLILQRKLVWNDRKLAADRGFTPRNLAVDQRKRRQQFAERIFRIASGTGVGKQATDETVELLDVGKENLASYFPARALR